MNPKPFFFFDLDGPILDVSCKYHRAYADVLEESGYAALEKDEYWRIKQLRTPVQEILARTGAADFAPTFRERRNARIESDSYLAHDQLQPQVKEVLYQLNARFRLVLVTLRSSRPQLLKELEALALLPFFEYILSSGAHTHPRWRIKYDLITDYADGLLPTGSWLIGDTDTDITAGNELGLTTVGVLSGIRTRNHLEAAKASYIIPDVSHLPGLL
jgi:phosphoglycolate phosphatase